MRSIFLSLCIVLLLAGGGFSASAQQKIAYVDIATIMKEIPEAQEAQRQLDAMVDRWQKELQELESDWQAKFNDYDKRKLILTDQGRANAERELQELDSRIMQFRDQKFGQNGELFREEDRIMRPIQDLVFDQVKSLALELNFDYVLDKSGGVNIIYAKEEHDLTKKAIERIKTTLPARDVPGAQQPGGRGTQEQRPPNRTQQPGGFTPTTPPDSDTKR
jgi:outer membrane protein